MIYSFPTPRPDSEDDRLAFGFITRQSNCVIMRLVSGNSEDHLLIAIMVSTHWYILQIWGGGVSEHH